VTAARKKRKKPIKMAELSTIPTKSDPTTALPSKNFQIVEGLDDRVRSPSFVSTSTKKFRSICFMEHLGD
jgi:hypothetical protein